MLIFKLIYAGDTNKNTPYDEYTIYTDCEYLNNCFTKSVQSTDKILEPCDKKNIKSKLENLGKRNDLEKMDIIEKPMNNNYIEIDVKPINHSIKPKINNKIFNKCEIISIEEITGEPISYILSPQLENDTINDRNEFSDLDIVNDYINEEYQKEFLNEHEHQPHIYTNDITEIVDVYDFISAPSQIQSNESIIKCDQGFVRAVKRKISDGQCGLKTTYKQCKIVTAEEEPENNTIQNNYVIEPIKVPIDNNIVSSINPHNYNNKLAFLIIMEIPNFLINQVSANIYAQKIKFTLEVIHKIYQKNDLSASNNPLKLLAQVRNKIKEVYNQDDSIILGILEKFTENFIFQCKHRDIFEADISDCILQYMFERLNSLLYNFKKRQYNIKIKKYMNYVQTLRI